MSKFSFEAKIEYLANGLMFGKTDDLDALLRYTELQYRKGKNIEDIIKAKDKALKNGRQKTEIELDMFQLYLKMVLKNEVVPK